MKPSEKAQIEFDKLEERIKELQSQIQYLTITYKYAEFDAEASKRERDYYKNLLREKE